MKSLTLGSLFDGSGGFPLAGAINGITPVWASEIEPYPLSVTKARLPGMVQLGDVTKIDGAAIPPVDIITFGSPCQDLSIAGKQKGLHEGERSSLFFHAIRIIREMRNEDVRIGRSGVDVRPRFAVWENVCGAFSSRGGADFGAVLQSLAEITECGISIPRPPRGKWNNAGCVVGDGWSIAWRTYDAQYWGVPQRRRRIYLIADFGSERAAEILFEPECVRWNPATGKAEKKGTSADTERSTGGSCVFGVDCRNATLDRECVHTIQAHNGGGYSLNSTPSVCYPMGFAWANSAKAGLAAVYEGTPTIKASRAGIPAVVFPEKARCLTAEHDASPCVDRGQNVAVYRDTSYGGKEEGVGTIRASGGDAGGF